MQPPELSNELAEMRNKRPPLEVTAAALQAMQPKTSKTLVYGLSDLSTEDVLVLKAIWENLSASYRAELLSALLEYSESNFELDYTMLARMALEDAFDGSRKAAVDLLWDDTTLATMDKFVVLAAKDSSMKVRAAAAAALGRFVLAGELDELPQAEVFKAQQVLAELWSNPLEDVEVRRRALESLANSSHPLVASAIAEAYDSDDECLQISALFAMGRSCDERWADIVLAELENEDAEFRYEAARAAGELEIESAVPILSRLLYEDDVDIRDVAIWSLGEIGGKEAVRGLKLLAKDAKIAADHDLMKSIEDALANADLNGSNVYMMRFDE